jgi:hypothetical protein
MKSAREHRLNTCMEKNLNSYDFSKNVKRSVSKHTSNSSFTPAFTLGIKFPKNKKKKTNLNILIKKVINKSLQSYNCDNKTFCNKIINDIIYDEKKHIVSVFKDYLLWDEGSDFLKRYYFIAESTVRIPKISAYYQMYTAIKPVYFNLVCFKVMIKHVRKLRKYLEQMEENEEKVASKHNKAKENNFSKLVKSFLVEDSKAVIKEGVKAEKKLESIKQVSDSIVLNDEFQTTNILRNKLDSFIIGNNKLTNSSFSRIDKACNYNDNQNISFCSQVDKLLNLDLKYD